MKGRKVLKAGYDPQIFSFKGWIPDLSPFTPDSVFPSQAVFALSFAAPSGGRKDKEMELLIGPE